MRYLDRGIDGIVVPHVETVAQLKAMKEALHDLPLGRCHADGRTQFHQEQQRHARCPMHQTKKGKPFSIEAIERIKASIRAKVEHPFRVIKRQFGYTKVRYRGWQRNTAQLTTLFAWSNLWMARQP